VARRRPAPSSTELSRTFLETPRLRLLDRAPEDFEFLVSLYRDPEVMRYIGDGVTFSRDEVESRYAAIDRMQREAPHRRWDAFKVIVRKVDDERLGQAGLLRCEIDGMPQVEIGWWLAPFAWGNGYATEAAAALRDYAFGTLRLKRLTVVLNARNAASIAVARRLGGVPASEAMYRGRLVTRYLIHAAPPGATGTGRG
jgi:ribosomal-protein-alanine N-acetyltransferase